MPEIVNRIANSGLINIDLEEFLPSEGIVALDLSDQLWNGLVIKEKDFREWVSTNSWEAYTGQVVAIFCSADAIIPAWAFMLVASALTGVAEEVHMGRLGEVKELLVKRAIEQLNLSDFTDGRVVVKGCGREDLGASVYVALTNKLQPVVKTLMYGEPCSTVPIFKKPKSAH
jgi:hypothetical protein